MPAIDGSGLVLSNVRKAFQKVVAVDNLSFSVPVGSIFGLVGANGAGKTTTLRMVLNIIAPDAGAISWNGQPAYQVSRDQFGYLPEERGLYPKMKTGDELVFLAGLNNIGGTEATQRAREWLHRMGLDDAWNRKVEELSKGNQQKVQVLAAILHDPQLMMLDEPFSGLDPINTEVLRDTLLQRRSEGRTIIFSSHRLEQVEELCDHVAIIHKGGLLLTGPVSEVKARSGRRLVEVAFDTPGNGSGRAMPDLERFLASLTPLDIIVHERRSDGVRIELNDGTESDQVLRNAIQYGPGSVRRFELVQPTLQEIFIEAVSAADPQTAQHMIEEGVMPGAKVLTEG